MVSRFLDDVLLSTSEDAHLLNERPHPFLYPCRFRVSLRLVLSERALTKRMGQKRGPQARRAKEDRTGRVWGWDRSKAARSILTKTWSHIMNPTASFLYETLPSPPLSPAAAAVWLGTTHLNHPARLTNCWGFVTGSTAIQAAAASLTLLLNPVV